MDIAKLSVLVINIISFLFFSCGNDKPQLSQKHREWKIFNRDLKIDDPNYPLEAIEDGYKMIRAFHIEARKIKDIELPSEDKVEWGWKFTLKNKSDKRLYVTIEYILKDEDSFEITSDSKSDYIEPNETITIRSTSTFDYHNLERVASSGGVISYSEK